MRSELPSSSSSRVKLCDEIREIFCDVCEALHPRRWTLPTSQQRNREVAMFVREVAVFANFFRDIAKWASLLKHVRYSVTSAWYAVLLSHHKGECDNNKYKFVKKLLLYTIATYIAHEYLSVCTMCPVLPSYCTHTNSYDTHTGSQTPRITKSNLAITATKVTRLRSRLREYYDELRPFIASFANSRRFRKVYSWQFTVDMTGILGRCH